MEGKETPPLEKSTALPVSIALSSRLPLLPASTPLLGVTKFATHAAVYRVVIFIRSAGVWSENPGFHVLDGENQCRRGNPDSTIAALYWYSAARMLTHPVIEEKVPMPQVCITTL